MSDTPERILRARYPSNFEKARRPASRFVGTPNVEALRARLVNQYPSMEAEIDRDLGLTGFGSKR